VIIEPKSSSARTTASDQAAAWFARRRSGSWSGADAADFTKWLKANSTHGPAWASYERLWGSLESARDDPNILAIREEARRNAAALQIVGRAWHIGTVVAASVLLGSLVWWAVEDRPTMSVRLPSPVPTASGPDTAALIRDASTDIGERSLLVLADGSKLTLNTASAVHADVSGRERRVTLIRGEAFFDVAKDATRPFIVAAGSRQVIAVGTVFDVRLQEKRLRVTLIEGKVRVVGTSASAANIAAHAQPVSAVTLEAGSALIAQDDGSNRVERLDTARATSWRNGKLIFDGETLAEVVAEMNRYSRETLEIADPTLEGRKVSGVFEPTAGPAFAKALEAYGIARATRQTATTIILGAPR
jgi:transmembrane sensor